MSHTASLYLYELQQKMYFAVLLPIRYSLLVQSLEEEEEEEEACARQWVRLQIEEQEKEKFHLSGSRVFSGRGVSM